MLLLQDRGIRLRLNVPHTILLQYGKLSSWWNTQLVRSQWHAAQPAGLVQFNIPSDSQGIPEDGRQNEPVKAPRRGP